MGLKKHGRLSGRSLLSDEAKHGRKASQLKAPIFVWEPNDLDVFSSVDDACRHVEKYDLPVLVGYDSEGRKFHFGLGNESIEVFGRPLWKRERVIVVESESVPASANELHAILLQVLSAIGHPADASAPLPALVEKTVRYIGAK